MRYTVRGTYSNLISEKIFDDYRQAIACAVDMRKEGWKNVVVREKTENTGPILKNADTLAKIKLHKAIYG